MLEDSGREKAVRDSLVASVKTFSISGCDEVVVL